MVAILAVIAMLVAMAGCAATNDSLVNEPYSTEDYVETITLQWLFPKKKPPLYRGDFGSFY
jgi:hypothetical protein